MTDALLVVRRMLDEYKNMERKLYIYVGGFVDIVMAFDRVPRDDGVDNEKEMFSASNCNSGNEPSSWGKDNSWRGIRVV